MSEKRRRTVLAATMRTCLNGTFTQRPPALERPRVTCWPYPGAVGVIERDEGMEHIYVVRNWCYLTTVTNAMNATKHSKVGAGFDADGYKILCNAILKKINRRYPSLMFFRVVDATLLHSLTHLSVLREQPVHFRFSKRVEIVDYH